MGRPTLQSKHSMNLTAEQSDDMVQSGAIFAHGFAKDDLVLDKIDKEILRRSHGQCVGKSGSDKDPCAVYGDPEVVKPSGYSKRLETLLLKLLDSENFRSSQCK